MPNIEIHMPFTTNKLSSAVPSLRAQELRNEIWLKVSRLPLANDVVVTFVNSICRDRSDIPQPFIRIACTNQKEIDALVEKLSGLIDIEVCPLKMFVEENGTRHVWED